MQSEIPYRLSFQKDAEASLPPLCERDPLILQMDDMVLPVTWKFKYRYLFSPCTHIMTYFACKILKAIMKVLVLKPEYSGLNMNYFLGKNWGVEVIADVVWFMTVRHRMEK
jgi:hypothetical protein